MDDQVHFPVGALAQFADDLIVFVDVQFFQVLCSDQLELLQDVNGGAGAVGRGVHCGGGTGPGGRGLVWRRLFLRNRRSRKENKVHCEEKGSTHVCFPHQLGCIQNIYDM